MNNEIKICVKSVYGRELIYPACEQGKLFTKLTRSTTLKLGDLDAIKALGFTVTQVDAFENALAQNQGV